MALIPDDDFAVDLVKSFGHDAVVEIRVMNRRNNMRLRAYWMMLRECIEATGCAPNTSALHKAVKMGIGLADAVMLKGGEVLVVPGSISFEKMTEVEMIAFFEQAQEYLAREFGYG